MGRTFADYDLDAWGYNVGGWQCEGDALGIYAFSHFSRSGGLNSGINDEKWRWHPNWQDCLNLRSRVNDNNENSLCPSNCICCLVKNTCNAACGDNTCPCSVGCERGSSDEARSWCEGGYQDVSTSGFRDGSQSYLQAGSRRQAKATRQAVIQSYSDASGSATATCR